VNWYITTSKRLERQIQRLPARVRDSLQVLVAELQQAGPVRGNWPNYSSLGGGRQHCHLKKGRSTYVAVWRVVNPHPREMEILYVGTHEKAPY
jgi:hypothetical protein